ncbi:MAG: ABC transporter ATP-binding protein [Pusillimonas sp.]|nr:ABC transporter ATP-binding protein [Pusillimonas sp.]
MTQTLLSAKNVTRRFGGLVAIDNVSVDLDRGQVHAVIGTNGAGKSTLINVLSGEIPPNEGSIIMNGTDITRWPQPNRARAGLGRSYQRTTIFPSLTVHENCRLSAQAKHQKFWSWATSSQSCQVSNEAANRALELTGLADVGNRTAGLLSHGGKRQLEIAMCLATHPAVLLLDEPLAGMGAEETDRMLDLLDSLKKEHAILLVEHDMDAVFRISDLITVMVNGTVIAHGDPETIRTNPEVQTAYLGEDE